MRINSILSSITFLTFLFLLNSTNSKFLKDLYHSTEEIYQELDKLIPQCNGILSKQKLQSDSSPLNQMTYYTISSPNLSTNYQKAFMIFGEHARELISSEQALFLIQVLCRKSTPKYEDLTIDFILSKIKFYIVPIVNEYGRKVVQNGDYCERTNENGVDLNRNWDSHWEFNSEKNNQYPGDKPFSEWETRSLRKLLENIKPNIFISTHAGTLGMYTPFAYKKFNFDELDYENGKRLQTMLKIVKRVNEKYCNCKAGSIGNELWYLCPGTCLDYSYENLNIKYTFAFEIYDGESTNPHMNQILNDPNLKTFNHNDFKELHLNDQDFHQFKSFIQLSNRKKFLNKNNNDHIHNENLTGVSLFQFEKMNFHKDKNFNDSCFSQTGTKVTSGEDCMVLMNPLNELHFRNTLINWVNVYFEVFALVSDYETK